MVTSCLAACSHLPISYQRGGGDGGGGGRAGRVFLFTDPTIDKLLALINLEVEPALEGPAPITNGPRKMSEHSRNSQYLST